MTLLELRASRRRNCTGEHGWGSVGVATGRAGRSARYNQDMAESTVRDQIIQALEDLPPDVTFDEAIERLVFLAKIEAGLAELDAGKGIPHEEVKRRLGM